MVYSNDRLMILSTIFFQDLIIIRYSCIKISIDIFEKQMSIRGYGIRSKGKILKINIIKNVVDNSINRQLMLYGKNTLYTAPNVGIF